MTSAESELSSSDPWDAYWQGRSGAEDGVALTGEGVETSEELKSVWRQLLSGRAQDDRLLDLACGAGSVTRTALGLGFKHLFALDFSDFAVRSLSKELPDTKTLSASADQTPFSD